MTLTYLGVNTARQLRLMAQFTHINEHVNVIYIRASRASALPSLLHVSVYLYMLRGAISIPIS